ncbi:F-box/kelch-repeat protein At1g80440-like [Diospyros lotus]|uniref:F-box/kelch-repeat protein At1g80440-like n=1 Tax=Diospyros lotus TaxID=55363 RepID=UPI00224D0576|nr:F-box/kelch-repeat protein At1g80440-like [Diospyros lotus]
MTCSNSSMELLPGLPDHLALECLIRLPFHHFSVAASVSKAWNAEIQMPEFRRRRDEAGFSRSVLVLAQARVDPNRERNSKVMATPAYRLTLCDPESGSWSELPPLPAFSDGLPMFCGLVGVGSELVVMGGCEPGNWRISNSVFVYSFVSGKWRRGAPMPGGPRIFFGCVSDSGGAVYVAGGHDDEKNALKSAMTYDVARDEWAPLPDMAEERDECKAVFHRGKLHVISGYPTEMQGRFRADSEALDISAGRWDHEEESLCSATCPRTCVDDGDGRLYMCQDGNVMAREEGTWERVAALPAAVRNVAHVTAWQSKLVVIGCERYGEAHRAQLMDLKSGSWNEVAGGEEYGGHVQGGCYLEI